MRTRRPNGRKSAVSLSLNHFINRNDDPLDGQSGRFCRVIVVVAVKSALEGLDFSRFLDLFDIGLVMDQRNQVEATWLEIVDHFALFEKPSRFEVVDNGCYPLRAFRVGVVVLILVLALF